MGDSLQSGRLNQLFQNPRELNCSFWFRQNSRWASLFHHQEAWFLMSPCVRRGSWECVSVAGHGRWGVAFSWTPCYHLFLLYCHPWRLNSNQMINPWCPPLLYPSSPFLDSNLFISPLNRSVLGVHSPIGSVWEGTTPTSGTGFDRQQPFLFLCPRKCQLTEYYVSCVASFCARMPPCR